MVLSIFYVSCRKSEDFTGPAITKIELPDSMYFEVSKNQVDLSGDGVGFYTNLPENVAYNVEILGEKSGAKKHYTGMGGLSLLQLTWSGSSDNGYFFRQGEYGLVQFTIPGTSLVFEDTVLITGARNYEGILINDFESTAGSANSIFSTYHNPGSEMVSVNFSYLQDVPQGSRCLHISGMDKDSTYWVSMASIVPTHVFTEIRQIANEKVYINLLVKASSCSGLNVLVYEDDNLNGSFEEGKEDAYSVMVETKHTGWKFFNFSYDALVKNNSVSAGGNGIPEPKKLFRIALVPVIIPAGGKIDLSVDYIMVTKGKALVP